MHCKDAPNVFFTLEKQITTKYSKEKNMEKIVSEYRECVLQTLSLSSVGGINF